MDVLTAAFLNLMTFEMIVILIIGTVAGMVIGALPGLSSTMGVALVVPVTFAMPADQALVLLGAVYVSTVYGGSITAILLRTPGTDASIATSFDGYPLAQAGRGSEAIGMSTIASLFGGTFSTVVLLMLAPLLSTAALMFGPPEYVLVTIFGLLTIVGISEGNLHKGFIMAFLGLLVATIGLDPFTGSTRYTLDLPDLFEGIPLLPMLIGLFSVSQGIALSVPRGRSVAKPETLAKGGRVLPKWKTLKGIQRTFWRSSVLGVLIGILPGAGTATAAFISYNEARRKSRNREEFGKGSFEGIAAAEAANNAVTGGTLVPTLTLGIPGNAVTAVFIGGLTIHGMIPGPRLFTEHAETTYTLILSLFIANFLFAIIGVFLCRWLVRVTVVPGTLLGPVIIVLATIGCYALRNNVFDVGLVLLFGLFGFFLERWRYPMSAFVIAAILGRILEPNFIRSMQIFAGDWTKWFQRPLSLFLMALILFAAFYPVYRLYRKRASARES
jgi:putative tricarboxylic transport membrane protein